MKTFNLLTAVVLCVLLFNGCGKADDTKIKKALTTSDLLDMSRFIEITMKQKQEDPPKNMTKLVEWITETDPLVSGYKLNSVNWLGL